MIPFLTLCLLASGIPDSGTRHDLRRSFLELAASFQGGTPDVLHPQIELMAKRRGWPVFLSGRFGLGIGFWGDHGAASVQPQVALHWSRDGEDSWALRVGWVLGEWFQGEVDPDTAWGHHGYASSRMVATTLAVERTAYFGRATDFAWRAALGVGAGFHEYEYRGVPGERTDILQPVAEVGLVWTAF
jgi:hypothetical protein